MKKTKSILLATLVCLIIGVGAVGLSSCDFGGHDLTDGNSSAQREENQFRVVYDMYVVYAEAQGVEPDSYEDWLASIKDETGEDGVSVVDVEITYAMNKNNENVMIFTFYMSDNSTIVEEVVIDKVEIPEEEQKASEGLEYKLNEDGESYSVTGIGTCEDSHVVIPSTYEGLPVTSIGDEAFFYNYSIASIEIHENIELIGLMAFVGVRNLENIIVAENNPYYKSIDGNLYSKDGTVLIQYAVKKADSTFLIPEHVTEIAAGAFCCCESLTSINIPNNVNTIGDGVFCDCHNLTSVTFSERLSSIADGLLHSCYGLTDVTIPNSITSIGFSVFYDINNLTSVYYKGTVADWSALLIGESNPALNVAVIYYYSETEPTEEGNYWHYDENGEIAVW